MFKYNSKVLLHHPSLVSQKTNKIFVLVTFCDHKDRGNVKKKVIASFIDSYSNRQIPFLILLRN